MITLIEYSSAQFSSKNNNSNNGTGNEVNLWLNAVILLVLIILFVYSVRFSPKCRRRRRKLPHEIRLEKTNKQKHAQFKDLNESLRKSSSFINKLYKGTTQDDQYINIDEDEYDENIDQYDLYGHCLDNNTDNITESKDSDYDDDDDDDMSVSIDDLINDSDNSINDNKSKTETNGNVLESGKLLINNINHYIQTQYDEYRENHSNFMQDILGMNSYNNPQKQYRDPSTKQDSDYDQL